MARYAIGDVQGCMNELQALLEKIHFDPSQDQLWFVGDLVNRGPASLAVLRFVRSLGPHAVTVLGNHDLHLLSVDEGVAASRADDTVQDILNAYDRAELLDWLRQQPLIHRAADWTMVHAGLLPSWSIAQATALAHEIEVQLRGSDYRALLSSMYGSEPNVWQDSLSGAPRHRVIVNAFTRMRLCSMDGRMQLQFKGTPQQAPIDYLPWFVDVYTERPDELAAFLKIHNIQTRPTYPELHTTPMYLSTAKYPNATYVASRGLFLPSHTLVTQEDVVYICRLIRYFFGVEK